MGAFHDGLVFRLSGARRSRRNTGILEWEQIAAAIRPNGPHCAPTALIEIENTHNMAGGTVYPLELFNEICDNAHDRGLKVHWMAREFSMPLVIWIARSGILQSEPTP